MLDIKFIRQNKDLVRKAIENKAESFDLDKFLDLDERRRQMLTQIESLRAEQNSINDEISALLKAKKDPKEKINQTKDISGKISQLESDFKHIKDKFSEQILQIPNIPHDSVPAGDISCNKTIREWGKARQFDFKPLPHTDIARSLDIIDFPSASKISGSNFSLFKGQGALLERALLNFMLDLHTQKHGYKEIFPPFLVNRDSMTGTGQLPKLEDDMYRIEAEDLFLIPTAEVPVTNIHRNDTLDEDKLPLYYTAYTACFRREAGSYGKDTKGLMRVHQFNKVELVKFVEPGDSYKELELLVKNAEQVLQLLELPYRVVMLASADLSFAASKCYDIEAYAPGVDKWLEVSSCSNFEDFQARRANIKYRPQTTDHRPQTKYLHTLNGSGVALARTVIAIIENYQNPDGTVTIPKVLRRYMHESQTIKPE